MLTSFYLKQREFRSCCDCERFTGASPLVTVLLTNYRLYLITLIMATEDSRADLLDPGDIASPVDMETNDSLTDSQLRNFEENDFNDVDLAGASLPFKKAGGRKRKGSSSVDCSAAVSGKRHLPEIAAVAARPSDSSLPVRDETYTSSSVEDGPVILVKPADEPSKRMFMSPELLCTSLEAAPFSDITIKDVRVNSRKGLVAIELAPDSASSVNDLLQLTKQ